VEEQTDKVFIKNFSMVVAALVVVAFIFAFIANAFKTPVDDSQNAARIQKIEERIKPVAGAYTDASAVAAAEQQAPVQAEQPVAPFDGSTDGELIFNNVCSACHTTGAAGAPKPGSPEMATRSEKGPEALFQSATQGLNAMPPRGGRPDLTDEQIKAAIEFMTK